MKRTILILFMALIAFKSNAQVWSSQLIGFCGTSNIFYPIGYYQGQVNDGFANGIGTFYFNDGSFYYGNFHQGLWDGPGVLVSRMYGYLSGCFSCGVFVGICQGVFNPYQTNTDVKELVTKVQDEKPDNENYEDYDPDGYKIIKIDANTQMGKVLLGTYKGEH